MFDLREGETLDELLINGMRLIQKKDGFRYTSDAVLLAYFADARINDRVVDLGSGTGIIPFLLAGRERSLCVYGLEIQPDLVEMARRSAAINGLAERVRMLFMDLRDQNALRTLSDSGKFQLATANPPYWEAGRGRLNADASSALSRHQLTGSLSDFVGAAKVLLADKGRLALIYISQELPDVLELLNSRGFKPSRIRFIHSRADQPAEKVLIEAYNGRRPGKLIVAPPLIVYDSPGVYSGEVLGWYGRTQK